MSSFVTELADLLGQALRPGDFYTRGIARLLAPSLTVDGVGPIALPLLPVQAEQLVAVAERAPYGRGPDTIIDTSVRNTWQIGPPRVRIEGRHWPQTLAAMLELAAEGLGVSDPIEAEFYKLLIYDKGSFFVSHRDTEKAPGMFATLVVVLPSFCTGGELVVRHKDRSVQLDLRTEDPAEAAFAAFYADCLHEVLPVTAGCRLSLIYNLIRRGTGGAPQPPSYASEQDKVAALLRGWRAAMDGDEAVPEKLVYPLEHAYTAPELDFSVLKGADAAAAGVLAAAAKQADCAVHLALVTLEEFGSAGYGDDYGRRRSWSRDDDDDDDFEVGEIDDWNIALSDWRAPDGNPVPWGEIPVTEDELSPPDPFHELEPDELHFEEASGNAGVSFERRYRRAALVVWPNDRALAVLTQAGLGVTVPHLLDLAERWAASGADRASPLWREAHELAERMGDDWPDHSGTLVNEDSHTTGLLTALTRLGDTDGISGFLCRVAGAGKGYARRDNPAVIAALELFAPDRAAELVAMIVAANAGQRFAACADLLARAALSPKENTALAKAAASLLGAMPRGAAAAKLREWSWRGDKVDPAFVADMLTALSAIDAALADQAVAAMLDDPKLYDFDTVLVPAAAYKLGAAANLPAVARLRAACLAHVRARIALPLAPPPDWKRASTVGCRCARCGELSRFLADATQQTWTYRAVEADRGHVAETIRTAACDLDTITEKKGRPYSLICTKNQATHERRVTQRQQDLRDEASLVSAD
nr:2OG-Fe(II) oxygenase [uncultured Rhodopila sp.]